VHDTAEIVTCGDDSGGVGSEGGVYLGGIPALGFYEGVFGWEATVERGSKGQFSEG
jgi:hypothetical protein